MQPNEQLKILVDRWKADKGKTQEDLAKRIGVSYTHLTRWITEDRQPLPIYRKAIKRILGSDPYEHQ